MSGGKTGNNDVERAGGGVTTLHSLADLGGVNLGQRLELPVIDLASLDPEVLMANAAIIEEKQAEIKKWVPRHLAALAAVEHLPEKAQRPARAKIAEVQEGLKEILENQNEYYRLAGRLAFILFKASQDVHSLEDGEEVILRLVEGRYLEESEQKSGLIRFHNRFFNYRVPEPKDPDGEGLGLEETEKEEVEDAFFALYYRASTAETLGDITWDEFRAHKSGTITLGFVPEEVKEDERSYWLPGGQLRIRSDGEKIFPVRITATNQRLRDGVDKAKDRGTYIALVDLDDSKEPLGGTLQHLLYTLIKRAEKPELARQEMRRKREDMAANLVNVTNEDFFLRGKPGIPYISLGSWKKKDAEGNLYDVYFFPERIFQKGAEGESPIPAISFLPERVPDHVREYLEPFAVSYDKANEADGSKKESFWGPHPEGEDFSGIPYPLCSLLRRARTLTEKTSRIGNGSNGK